MVQVRKRWINRAPSTYNWMLDLMPLHVPAVARFLPQLQGRNVLLVGKENQQIRMRGHFEMHSGYFARAHSAHPKDSVWRKQLDKVLKAENSKSF